MSRTLIAQLKIIEQGLLGFREQLGGGETDTERYRDLCLTEKVLDQIEEVKTLVITVHHS